MKKFLIYLTLLLIPTFIFCGCTNQNKTLARNLDNTITNLIYSVSSLDWADTNLLKNITDASNDDNANSQLKSFSSLNNNNNTSSYELNLTEPNKSNFNSQQPKEHYFGRHRNKNKSDKFNNTSYNQNNYEKKPNVNSQHQQNYRSGSKHPRLKHSDNQVSEITTLNNNIKSFSNNTTNLRSVAYSTTSIEDSNETIQETIDSLINERSNILLYINDLYKGNISLNNNDVTAINAYANIIKDNTSYLNSNKGLITNQLSQANQLVNSNSNSTLINAYIIRINEAIDTRLAKMDSSILAIQSICKIMETNLKNTSPYYNLNQNNLSNSNIPNNIKDSSIINNNSLNNDEIEPFNKTNLNPNDNFETKNLTNLNNDCDDCLNKNQLCNKRNNSSFNEDICENCTDKNDPNCPSYSNETTPFNKFSKNINAEIYETNNNSSNVIQKDFSFDTPQLLEESNTTKSTSNEIIDNKIENKQTLMEETNTIDIENPPSMETFASFIDKDHHKRQNTKTTTSGAIINKNENIKNMPYNF